MRKPSIGAEIRSRLLRAGFGRVYANRAARELQEHWDEIVEECLRSGIPERDAQKEAANRLGSPDDLANEYTARMQGSSWLGRHPVLGFSVLALALTILWWISFGSLAASVCGVFAASEQNPPQFELLKASFDWIRATSYLAVPSLCCVVAERYFCGWRAALWGCLVVAIHNAMHFMRVASTTPGHGNVAWGYAFNFANMPSILAIIAPLAVFAIYQTVSLRSEKQNENSNPQFC
jgi:hypothetical protein